MSEPINWCNLKENIKHVGEVSTSRQGGSPSGKRITTSTNAVTGDERDTLDGRLDKISGVYIGEYKAGLAFSSYAEYVVYNGQSYKPKSATALPFTTTNINTDLPKLAPFDNAKLCREYEEKADASADRAEAAAEAAAASGKIYATVEAGIAATADNELFLVVSDKESGFSDLYLNDAGTGVYKGKTTLDVNSLDPFVCQEHIGQSAFSISDENGNTLLTADNDGVITVKKIIETDVEPEPEPDPEPEPTSRIIEHIGIEDFSVIDEHGNASQRQTGDEFEPVISEPVEQVVNQPYSALPVADIIIVPNMGQSNAGTHWSFIPPTTSTLEFNNLIWDYDLDEPRPLAQADDQAQYPAITAVDFVTKQILENSNTALADFKPQYLVLPWQSGGTSITMFNTIHLDTFRRRVERIKNWCDENGKTCIMAFYTWTQGEADGGNGYTDDYAGEMQLLFDNVNAIAKELLHQKNPVKCMTWTLDAGDHEATVGLQKAADKNENIIICGSKYSGLYFGDGAHFDALGGAIFGAQYGKFYYQSAFLKSNPEPLRMTDVVIRSSTVIDVHVNKRGCVIDNVTHPAASGQGFYVRLISEESGDNVQIYPTDVRIINTKIKLTFDRDISNLLVVGFGIRHGIDIVFTGEAGNIRDESGEAYQYTINGTTHKIHNWLLPFVLNAEDL